MVELDWNSTYDFSEYQNNEEQDSVDYYDSMRNKAIENLDIDNYDEQKKSSHEIRA